MLALLERILFGYLPIGTLVVSYAVICSHTGTAWPWTEVVHEDGRRTLLQTVFFFEHATRELPLDFLLGAAVAGAMLVFYFPGRMRDEETQKRCSCLRQRFLALSFLVIILIVNGAAIMGGGREVVDNLSQLHTRPGAPLVWGSHWRYHLLERLATILLAFSVVGMHRLVTGVAPATSVRAGLLFLGITLAAFVGLTGLFGLTLEPFREATYLGHQARELFTHTLVTLPLALGVCFWLARTIAADGMAAWPGRRRWPIYVSGACGVFLGVYLALGTLLTKAHALGQSKSLVTLIFPHFFEHSFTYLVVPLIAGLCYLWLARPAVSTTG
jgi:hypothetical protein